MVHQHFALVDALSVAENLALSLSPPGALRWSTRGRSPRRAPALAAQIGLELGDLDAPVGTLPVGQRQRIEILKALAGDDPRPDPRRADRGADAGRGARSSSPCSSRLRAAGTAVLFITHKLREVMAIADRVTVMRRGRVVARVAAPGGQRGRRSPS